MEDDKPRIKSKLSSIAVRVGAQASVASSESQQPREESFDVREVPLKGSFLELCLRWGINDNHPGITEELAMAGNNFTVPNLSKTIEFCEELQRLNDKAKERPYLSGMPDDVTEATYPVWQKKLQAMGKADVPIAAAAKAPSIRAKLSKMIERQLGLVIPSVTLPEEVEARYVGISEAEKSIAAGYMGRAAVCADATHYADLNQWMAKTCAKHGIKKPRLVVVDSDWPLLFAVTPIGEPPSVMMSTNMMEIMPERQLKALLAHELSHIEERGEGSLWKTVLRMVDGKVSKLESVIREEFKADKRAVEIVGNADDLVDGLIATQQRVAALKAFALKFNKILVAHDVAGSAVPQAFQMIYQFAMTHIRLKPEPTRALRLQANAKDPHPDMQTRFERAFRAEDDLGRS